MHLQFCLTLLLVIYCIFLVSTLSQFGLVGLSALTCALSLHIHLSNISLSLGAMKATRQYPTFSRIASSGEIRTHIPSERASCATCSAKGFEGSDMNGCFFADLPFMNISPLRYCHLASTDAHIYCSGIQASCFSRTRVMALRSSSVIPLR